MENLRARLDQVENRQLDIYEKESADLSDQIEYWELVKEEHLILFAARRTGIQRLGHKVVPNLQVSEQNAKKAIEMVLVLKSLAQSPFAAERWTLRDTNRDLYETPPQYCFKKGGSHVHLLLSDDPDNMIELTAWEHIYCQNEDGTWYKKRGMIDYKGLFYEDADRIRFYYYDFASEAARHGSNSYEIYYKDMIVTLNTQPVFTSTRSQQIHQPQQTKKRSADAAAQERTSPSKRPRRGGRRGRLQSDIINPPSSPPKTRSATHTQGSSHRLRGRGGTLRGGDIRRRGEGESGVAPGEVGSAHQTPQRRPLSRVGHLLQEARDPPVIVLAGEPNSLKCLRYRIRQKHREFYTHISTNFKWVGGGKGQGSSRMILAFESSQQRKAFEERASFPASIRHFHGNFDQL
ncbi:E2 protein [Molossus molossus papillomavirus type 2]|nr:E2 protein [Molossus molossus papillomavirus type 2]